MKLTLTSLSSPVWANEERTAISCQVTFAELGSEVLLFNATAYDSEPHGRDIFARLVAGEFGPIQDPGPQAFVAPQEVSPDSIPAQVF